MTSDAHMKTPPPTPAAIPGANASGPRTAPASGTGGPVLPPLTPEVGEGVGESVGDGVGQVVLVPVAPAPTVTIPPSPASAITAAHTTFAANRLIVFLCNVGGTRRRRNPSLPSDPPAGGEPPRLRLCAITSATAATPMSSGSAGTSGTFGGGPPGHVLADARIRGRGASTTPAMTAAAPAAPVASREFAPKRTRTELLNCPSIPLGRRRFPNLRRRDHRVPYAAVATTPSAKDRRSPSRSRGRRQQHRSATRSAPGRWWRPRRRRPPGLPKN